VIEITTSKVNVATKSIAKSITKLVAKSIVTPRAISCWCSAGFVGKVLEATVVVFQKCGLLNVPAGAQGAARNIAKQGARLICTVTISSDGLSISPSI